LAHSIQACTAGILIETRPILQIPDTIAHREVEGEINSQSDYLTFENDSAFILRLPRHFYPIGTWTYYHANGQVKASGNYMVAGTSVDLKIDEGDSETSLQIRNAPQRT